MIKLGTCQIILKRNGKHIHGENSFPLQKILCRISIKHFEMFSENTLFVKLLKRCNMASYISHGILCLLYDFEKDSTAAEALHSRHKIYGKDAIINSILGLGFHR